jgi:antitoxin component YwqK of YwqJK toxin-antitoxin module
MKKILLIVLLLFVGCSKEPINFEQMLVERDNVYYTKDTNKPYSGTVFSLYDDGKKKSEGAFKNGYYNGKWTSWYANGQKYTEGTFKDDYYDGKWTSWYENGQKYSEGIYKDGNVISEKCWDEVGDECECLEYSSKYEDRDAITDEQIVNDYV